MNIKHILTTEEIRNLSQRSDLRAFRMLAINWLMIVGVFVMVAQWTNPFSIVLGILLLGGRQLGLGILMHECGHRTFFKTRRFNEFFGQWFTAYPTFSDMNTYASGHKVHHQKAGTPEDPDLPNYQAYPVTRESLKRKIIRDLTGQTGIKLLGGIFTRRGDSIARGMRPRRVLWKNLLVQGTMITLLAAFGVAWMYLLWVAAFITSYMFVLRIRQIAEHGGVPDLFDPDPRNNTRTTLASWWERLLFCPNYVNYHLEHHFLAGVPCYHLQEMHRLMVEKGAYRDTRVFEGYWQVLKFVTNPVTR